MNNKNNFERQLAGKDKFENSLENSKEKPIGKILKFEGVGNKDVYNITRPFEFNGHIYILGRVESKDIETDSQVIFFKRQKDGELWLPDENSHVFDKTQDPFFSIINGKLIVGGVEIYEEKKNNDKNVNYINRDLKADSSFKIGYKTVFYRVKNVNNVEKFAEGPDKMKDIRLVELFNGKIGVFSRPENVKTIWKEGRIRQDIYSKEIAYTEIDSIDKLNKEKIKQALIIKGLFKSGGWGGVNEAYLLGDGKIGVLGHKARINRYGNKDYRAVAFIFNPKTYEFSEMEIIADSKMFSKKFRPKKNYLEDVIFPGGYDKDNNTLYGGLRDKYPIAIKLRKKLFLNHGGIVERFIKDKA